MVIRRNKINKRVQKSQDYLVKTCIDNQGLLHWWRNVSRAIRKKDYNAPRKAQRASNGLCVKWVW